jgi:hypothetical protein
MMFEAAAAKFPQSHWLSWKSGPPPRATGLGVPLFFHHIAKTGGTSVISAIRSATPQKLAFSEDGNLSADFTRDLASRRLVPGQFIYGHPHTGAATPLRGRAAIITLLREPRDHAISSYVYVRSEPRLPDFKLARELDFRDFLLARPYYAFFQTASLHVGIEEQPITRVGELIDRLPLVLAYMREMQFLGTLEGGDRLLAHLRSTMQWTRAPSFRHRHKSRVSRRCKALLREQYADLQRHPALAPLFATERLVYETAREIEAEREAPQAAFDNVAHAGQLLKWGT